MLSEEQCKRIEKGLGENVEPRKVAAYLCLHMGLMPAEVAALRWRDIDLEAGTVNLRNITDRPGDGDECAGSAAPFDAPRTLPMPPHVLRYLNKHRNLYAGGERFILTGETAAPAFYHIQNVLTSICVKHGVAGNLSATDLRNAFIRRCIQSGVDLYSLCAYVGIRQPNVILKRFGEYFAPRLNSVNALEKYGVDYWEQKQARTPEPSGPRRMNLLILGAGSQGPVVKEIAETIGVFQEIAFLDDDPDNRLAIGPLSDYERYVNRYPIAIPSFGNCELRAFWADKLEQAGFILPVLVHPMASVSSSADLAEGVVIEAKAIVAAGVHVGRNCIVSAGAVLDKSSTVEPNTHVGCACTVTRGSVVPAYCRIPAGTVFGAEQ